MKKKTIEKKNNSQSLAVKEYITSQLETVRNSGASPILRYEGPLDIKDMIDVAELSKEQNVPICIISKGNTINLKDPEKIDELVHYRKVLKNLLLEIPKYNKANTWLIGRHKKEQLLKKKDVTEKKIKILLEACIDKEFYFYVNWSQQEFIKTVKRLYLEYNPIYGLLDLAKEHLQIGNMMRNVDFENATTELSALNDEGNYGTQYETFLQDQPRYEGAIDKESYFYFRKKYPDMIHHAAILYPNTHRLRMVILEKDFPRYAQKLLLCKMPKEELIFTRFSHSVDRELKEEIREQNMCMYSWETQYVIETLEHFVRFHRKNQIEYRVCVVLPRRTRQEDGKYAVEPMRLILRSMQNVMTKDGQLHSNNYTTVYMKRILEENTSKIEGDEGNG